MPYEAKVAPDVQPGVDIPLAVTPQALGAGIGDAVQNLGEVASDIHAKEVDHANRTNVLAADNAQQAFIQARMYDPKTGILNQNLGKDAPAAVDQALGEFDQSAARVEGGLTNDAQKLHFRQMVTERRLQMQDQLGKYEHAETERYADEVAKGSIANATTMAVQNANDPKIVADNIALQRAVIDHRGAAKGLAPEMIEAQQRDAASGTHLAVIQQLVSDGQDLSAKAWYDQNKGDLTGQDLTQATRLVEAGSLAGQSQRIATELLYDKDGNVRPRGEVLAEIQKDPRLAKDTRLRDAVDERAQHALGEHAQAKEETQKQTFDQAYQILTDPANTQGIANPKVVAAMATLDPERAQALKNYAAKDGKVTTDMHAWLALDNVLSDPAKTEEAKAIHLEDYVDKIDGPDLKALKTRIDAIKQGKTEIQNSDARIADVVKDTRARNLLAPGKPGSQEAADAADYEKTVREDCEAAAKEKGSPLTRDEIQKVADDNLIQVVTKPGLLWDTKAPAYKARAAVRFTSPTPTPEAAQEWRTVLAQPHAPGFDAHIATLQDWSRGKDQYGFPDPNRKAKAAALIAATVPSDQRSQIAAAWKAAHAGANPSDADILGVWALHTKRTTPVAVAPPASGYVSMNEGDFSMNEGG